MTSETKKEIDGYQQVLDILKKSETGRRTAKILEKEFGKLDSVVAIDKDNLKIAKFNGSLEKEKENLRRKFSIPTLIQDQDIYELYIMVGPKGYLLGVRQEDLASYLESQNIPNTPEAIYGIHFGTHERRRWYDDSLTPEQQDEFRESVFQILKKLHLSYGLYPWMETYVLYGKEDEVDGYIYHWAAWETFDLLKALEHGYPLTTPEKHLIRDISKRLVIMDHQKKTTRFDRNKVEKTLNVLPPRKERRKKRLEEAIEAIETHGQIEEQYDYTGFDHKEMKAIKVKITDDILADRLYPENKRVSSEAVKKLRQRYKSKLKKIMSP
jgi:hypothetical protein